MIKAVLFDLDGTIINSEEGITKCVQYALRAYGIDEPDRTKLRCFIGPPLDPVFREKYGMTEAEAWQSVEKYRERFDVKGIFECSLYDGVREAIARFKEHGYLLALASSKPETACRRILEHFDLLGSFDEVVGFHAGRLDQYEGGSARGTGAPHGGQPYREKRTVPDRGHEV